jgi:acyl-CoA dehydrogenase
VEIGRRHLPLGAAFMNGPNSGKDVFMPLDYLIGGQEMLGKGWMMLMNCLSVGRSISARGRHRRGQVHQPGHRPIRADSRAVQRAAVGLRRHPGSHGAHRRQRLADGQRAHAHRQRGGPGRKPSVLSAILKYHLTERGRECISHAMDVHGGKGIIMGPNNYLGRNWQGAPIFITVEGANILSRNLMIFGQGAIRCHPFVLKEMALAGREDQDQALKEFDGLLLNTSVLPSATPPAPWC